MTTSDDVVVPLELEGPGVEAPLVSSVRISFLPSEPIEAFGWWNALRRVVVAVAVLLAVGVAVHTALLLSGRHVKWRQWTPVAGAGDLELDASLRLKSPREPAAKMSADPTSLLRLKSPKEPAAKISADPTSLPPLLAPPLLAPPLLAAKISADPTSLFCFMVLQPPPSYEFEVAKYLLREGLGIFACEAWRVYSDRWSQPIALGSWAELPVETIPIPGPEAYYSTKLFEHRLLFNADVFYRAWEHILKDGIYQQYAFTVKVDPDAVFMPHRLKAQLHTSGRLDVPDVGRGKFFLNCPDFEAEGSFQGPLEVISQQAVRTFGSGKWKCFKAGLVDMPEDISIKDCMLKLGVERLALFGALYDRDCPRPEFHWWVDCSLPGWAAYHPVKGVENYKACYGKAKAQDHVASLAI